MIAPNGVFGSPSAPPSPAAGGRSPFAVVLTGVWLPAMLVVPIGWKAAARLSRPRPKIGSVPGAPRSSADWNRMLTICAPDRFGNASANSATAPLMVGAEKLVPHHLKRAPVWSGAG